MARSIHHNRSLRFWNQRQRDGWYVDKISKKRRLKRIVHKKRRSISFTEIPPVTSEAIPIRIQEEPPHFLYGVTIEDIRAVLDALPPGTLNGLTRISLEPGISYINNLDVEDYVLDPFLGRKSVELHPGIFSPVIGGKYDRSRCRIKLFGFVVDPSVDLSEVELLTLKLLALQSLMHEVAHHHDQTQRVARGRWLMDDLDKLEDYAEIMALRWSEKFVYPYLSARYGSKGN